MVVIAAVFELTFHGRMFRVISLTIFLIMLMILMIHLILILIMMIEFSDLQIGLELHGVCFNGRFVVVEICPCSFFIKRIDSFIAYELSPEMLSLFRLPIF